VSRPAPPGAGEGACRPGWDRLGTAVATRSDRTLMSTLGSSATTRTLSRHTRPAEVRPDMPETGVEQSTGQGKPVGGHLLDPVDLRPASGQRADHAPPYFPRLPQGSRGLVKTVPRQMGYPRLDR
jgi:hypothetical protein